jgi:hypothetical protein
MLKKNYYPNRRNHSSVTLINKNTFYAGLQPCIRKILLVLLLCRIGTYFQSGLIGIKQYESYVAPYMLYRVLYQATWLIFTDSPFQSSLF